MLHFLCILVHAVVMLNPYFHSFKTSNFIPQIRILATFIYLFIKNIYLSISSLECWNDPLVLYYFILDIFYVSAALNSLAFTCDRQWKMDDGGQRENGRNKLDYYKGPQNPVGKSLWPPFTNT